MPVSDSHGIWIDVQDDPPVLLQLNLGRQCFHNFVRWILVKVVEGLVTRLLSNAIAGAIQLEVDNKPHIP